MTAAALRKIRFNGLSLGTRVLLLVGGTTVVLVVALLVTSIVLYSKDKVTYIYDLQDLKTERLGDSLRRALEREVSQVIRKNDETVKLDVKSNPLDRGLPRLPEIGEIFVGDKGGKENILVFRDASDVRTAALPSVLSIFSKIEGVQALSDGEHVYWVTGFGNLLASTHAMESSRVELAKRPAVSVFLRNSLTKGLVTVIDEENNLVAGFKEIPGTNTAVFIETPLSEAMRPLRRFVAIAAFVGASVIIFGLLVSGLIFERMWKPMRAVRWFTHQIAEGEYNTKVPYEGRNEIGELFGFLSEMAKGLKAREEKIISGERQLRNVEADHARLEASIEAASIVQSQLIQDTKNIGSVPHLDIAAKCLPADKCSGDWYGFYYDVRGRMLVGVVTDVTGHGIASALITGVTAGVAAATTTMFELLRAKQSTDLTPQERLCFLHATLDGAIKNCGQTKILASAFLFCFHCDEQKLYYINAGHPSPLLFSANTKRPSFLAATADLLGLESILDPVHVKQVPLQTGDSVVMYTDGLLEDANKTGHSVGLKTLSKRLLKAAEESSASAQSILQTAFKETQVMRGNELQDDVTVVTLRGRLETEL